MPLDGHCSRVSAHTFVTFTYMLTPVRLYFSEMVDNTIVVGHMKIL